ncbi:STAS-like domain-containing protein [Leptospira santarosai]|uniref:PF14213 domain protein n=1 Tax=Leptospira santarosai str. MOR084 TaxID=1049984 RepID=A0A0E2BCV8_9LEPT|nr:STAS-like domain-containing protein [Leptospira santarosai]EKO33197.1 PF14213 domain protein [Leptospira santarosai str. MOR084]EMO21158.1 PF14213 domain protein [Leptospira santarosai str. HAI134]MDI7158413.1 STAS-like domain-containing protein [Leptospira santarosai]
MIHKIKISKDFSDVVGHRSVSDGPNSGEEFRKKFLEPAIANNEIEKIEIDMDDTWGYPSSFLEEAFGGLVRLFGKEIVEMKIRIISNQDESLNSRIQSYIQKAEKETN